MNHQFEKRRTTAGHIIARAAILTGFFLVLAGAFSVWTLYAFIFTAELTH